MPYESPVSVLFAPDGTEVTLSSSVVVSPTTPGFLFFASGSDGVQALSLDADGLLRVSGSFSAGTPVTQSVQVGGWDNDVVGVVSVQGTASVLLAPSIGTHLTSALATTDSYTLLPSRPTRRGATFFKEGSNTCFLALGGSASSTQYTVRLINNSYFELPFEYAGPVSVVFNNTLSDNIVLATEITASL